MCIHAFGYWACLCRLVYHALKLLISPTECICDLMFIIFWGVLPRSWIEIYRRFGLTCFLSLMLPDCTAFHSREGNVHMRRHEDLICVLLGRRTDGRLFYRPFD